MHVFFLQPEQIDVLIFCSILVFYSFAIFVSLILTASRIWYSALDACFNVVVIPEFALTPLDRQITVYEELAMRYHYIVGPILVVFSVGVMLLLFDGCFSSGIISPAIRDILPRIFQSGSHLSAVIFP